ncbi:MAG TPA: hypothetical protein VGG71_01020 [Chitinophagaceae bacterium]|jgi:hypothetical protein
MLKSVVSSFLISIIFLSCGFRVTENGHEVSPVAVSENYSDSILELNLSSSIKVPDSAIKLSDITVEAPIEKYYGYDSMLNCLKKEASKLGANLIVIKDYHALYSSKQHFRDAIIATAYKLDFFTLMKFKKEVDSVNNNYLNSLKNISKVHIKDYDDAGTRTIYFNDSLVGTIKGVGFDSFRKPGHKDYIFNNEGNLKFDTAGINIHLGKEYYIVLFTAIGKHQFYRFYRIVDKEHFYFTLD